jgi:hypothetical protein
VCAFLRAAGGFCVGLEGGWFGGGRLLIGGVIPTLPNASRAIGCLPRDWWIPLYDDQEHSQREQFHSGEIVTRISLTDRPYRWHNAPEVGRHRRPRLLILGFFSSCRASRPVRSTATARGADIRDPASSPCPSRDDSLEIVSRGGPCPQSP